LKEGTYNTPCDNAPSPILEGAVSNHKPKRVILFDVLIWAWISSIHRPKRVILFDVLIWAWISSIHKPERVILFDVCDLSMD